MFPKRKKIIEGDLFDFHLKAELKVKTPDFTQTVDYAIDWFEAHKSKPKVSVRVKPSTSSTYGLAERMIASKNYNADICVLFLIEFYRKHCIVNFPKPWVACDQVITKTVNGVYLADPSDILQVVDGNALPESEGGKKSEDKNDWIAMAILILWPYRWNEAKYDAYQTIINTKAQALLSQYGCTEDLRALSLSAKNLQPSQTYERTVAAFDMFDNVQSKFTQVAIQL